MSEAHLITAALIRQFLTMAGTYLIARGYFQGDSLLLVATGIVFVLIATGWAIAREIGAAEVPGIPPLTPKSFPVPAQSGPVPDPKPTPKPPESPAPKKSP
jgi:hypothetical protein